MKNAAASSSVIVPSQNRKKRAPEPFRDETADRCLLRERGAEIKADHPAKPLEVSHRRRAVQAELRAQCLDAFGSRVLSENRLGQIAWQQLGADENENRDDQKRQQTLKNAMPDQLEHRRCLGRNKTGMETAPAPPEGAQ